MVHITVGLGIEHVIRMEFIFAPEKQADSTRLRDRSNEAMVVSGRLRMQQTHTLARRECRTKALPSLLASDQISR